MPRCATMPPTRKLISAMIGRLRKAKFSKWKMTELPRKRDGISSVRPKLAITSPRNEVALKMIAPGRDEAFADIGGNLEAEILAPLRQFREMSGSALPKEGFEIRAVHARTASRFPNPSDPAASDRSRKAPDVSSRSTSPRSNTACAAPARFRYEGFDPLLKRLRAPSIVQLPAKRKCRASSVQALEKSGICGICPICRRLS